MTDKKVEDMLGSLKSLGVDVSSFSNLQLQEVMKIADKIKDPTKMSQSDFQTIGEILSNKNPVKIGVNKPCPCGSGKKFKKCCRR